MIFVTLAGRSRSSAFCSKMTVPVFASMMMADLAAGCKAGEVFAVSAALDAGVFSVTGSAERVEPAIMFMAMEQQVFRKRLCGLAMMH